DRRTYASHTSRLGGEARESNPGCGGHLQPVHVKGCLLRRGLSRWGAGSGGDRGDSTERGSKMAQSSDPKKPVQHGLGMALGAERKMLTMLRKLERSAERDELKQHFRRHHEETEGQIRNLEQAFELVGARATAHEAESASAVVAEGEKLLGKVDEELIDAGLLDAAAKAGHLDIAMYQGPTLQGHSTGEDKLVSRP